MIINQNQKGMKTLIYFLSLFLVSGSLQAQTGTLESYLLMNPSDIIPASSSDQVYDVTLKWQNLDAINGNHFNCNVLTANYIVGSNHDSVRWNNVRLGQIRDFAQQEYETSSLHALNGFTYQANSAEFLKENFYRDISADQRDLVKWLVSDAAQMQGLANYIFDSLEFNRELYPTLLNDYDIEFEDWVTFSSRYQKLIWSGITRYNGEPCAMVRFESLYNPVKIDNDQMKVSGRSLYYGEMWISLTDKQVEYASMVEDVVFKLGSSLFPDEQLVDLQREVIFDKSAVLQ